MNTNKNIKCILFDLGGVVINIDWKRSVHSFSKLTCISFDELNSIMRRHELVQKIETGSISSEEFRTWFKEYFNLNFEDEDIDEAWNDMLLDIPGSRIELIENLKSNYLVMCLSNTNAIHIDKFNSILYSSSGIKNLESLMHKTYYSHLIKARKPDPKSWEIVLNENKLKANEVLFLDDNENNIEVSAELGFETKLVTKENSIEKIFHEQTVL